MSIADYVRRAFGPIPEPEPHTNRLVDLGDRQAIAKAAKASRVQTRAIDSYTTYPDWNQSILNAFGLSSRPWRAANINDALSVPAIFRAVSLISNTTGSLAMETYRNGQLLSSLDAPRLVTRPDPYRIPRDFYRDTAYHLATRGESWWWVARRDGDGLPQSLIVVPPWEVTVDDTEDRLTPKITWRQKDGKEIVMPNRDMRQITLLPGTNGRGVGPLQLCQAAVSVAVESQEWAANFYAEGGMPSLWVKAAGTLGDRPDPDNEGEFLNEAQILLDQFRARDHNTPVVTDDGVEDIRDINVNTQGAQMLEARQLNKGDVANMFGIPGVLLEYSAPGSSLTYQNVQEVFRLFVKASLAPQFLVPIEEEMSDLLPRSTSAHFNLDSFERADPKARWETYKIMSEVIGQEEAGRLAREGEGLTAGDIEFMPIPPAPPAAFPTQLPVARSSEPVRCTGRRVLRGRLAPCNKLLAESGPFVGTCPRCRTTYEAVA
jgi:HK97 family phage portal protein